MPQDFENIRKEQPLSPEKTLDYVATLGGDLAQYAKDVQLMLEIAKDRGIDATLTDDETLKKFEPLGEFEMKLVEMRSQMLSLKTKLLEQGVKVTAEEMEHKRTGKSDISQVAPMSEQSIVDEKSVNGYGLGPEKNALIADFLTEGNYAGLLDLINSEPDKEKACEVVTRSMVNFHQVDRHGSVQELLRTGLSHLSVFGDALKALVLYTWKNNLKGDRLWKNPDYDETLFVDDDGELISFKGEIGTHTSKDVEGMNYIQTLTSYAVLTGPNAGKQFSSQERPLRGPETA